MLIEPTINELRPWAKKLDDYEAATVAKAKKEGRPFPVFDYAEHGVPPEIEAAIMRLRSPERLAAQRTVVRDLDGKAQDARRFANLHRTKIEALTKEIADLMAAAEKHKNNRGKSKKPPAEWDAEAERLGKEIDKATRAKATAERGAEKQDSEAARYDAEARAAESAIGEGI